MTVTNEKFPVEIDNLGNAFANSGCHRCWCGCKYWENDACIDCGEEFDFRFYTAAGEGPFEPGSFPEGTEHEARVHRLVSPDALWPGRIESDRPVTMTVGIEADFKVVNYDGTVTVHEHVDIDERNQPRLTKAVALSIWRQEGRIDDDGYVATSPQSRCGQGYLPYEMADAITEWMTVRYYCANPGVNDIDFHTTVTYEGFVESGQSVKGRFLPAYRLGCDPEAGEGQPNGVEALQDGRVNA